MAQAASRLRTVLALGLAQTLAWASSYYLPAILATPVAQELGVGTSTVFAAFSVGLVISAFLGPRAGRAIDTLGGRPVLALSNLVFACSLAGLGVCNGPLALFAAWVVMGIGMSIGLYEAAFAALVRLYGHASRNPITGITLLAGFASTVGWPLSSALLAWVGWRETCLVWAALHVLLGLPLNLLLPRVVRQEPASSTPLPTPGAAEPHGEVPLRSALLLAWVFAVTWFISTAMAAHLPVLLKAAGVGLQAAVFAGAMIGPAQVAGRVLEFGVLRRAHPLFSARMAAALHPLAALILMVAGAPGALPFAVLHGAGNGILTIAKGTLPLALFGPQGYGERQGLLMVPARLAQAISPWLFGLVVERWGTDSLWLSGALGLTALAALFLLHPAQRSPG